MQTKHLILLARYSKEMACNYLIPEIEKNCTEYGVICPKAYEIWKNNKFPPNSMYFHHSYAKYAIPMGEEYDKIAVIKDFELLPDTIQDCRAKIVCFFTAYKTQPNDTASEGHHELSLIQFEPEIPQLFYEELFEVAKPEPLELHHPEILLFKSGDMAKEIVYWEEQK